MGRRRSLCSAGRRRRASSGDAVAGILILGALAIAALGVYLLVIGAIALVGWIVAVAAKRQSSVQAAQFAPASTQSNAPLPNQHYIALLPVDPSVFDDQGRLEAAASTVFATWARQLPKAPSDPRITLRTFTLHKRLIGRLTTKLDGRRFALVCGVLI